MTPFIIVKFMSIYRLVTDAVLLRKCSPHTKLILYNRCTISKTKQKKIEISSDDVLKTNEKRIFSALKVHIPTLKCQAIAYTM